MKSVLISIAFALLCATFTVAHEYDNGRESKETHESELKWADWYL